MKNKDKPIEEERMIGWKCTDIVKFKRTWCVICAKQRSFEIWDGEALCLGCYERVTESELDGLHPPFQIERFIREGM